MNDRRDNPSRGGVPFKVSCAIEIEKREDLWYNKISINRNLKEVGRKRCCFGFICFLLIC